ncbi:LLM class F420-dependent oxidoreductase [Kutzneria sp. CA-103260]|uniref:LLM class F420-dependent oxidoreductase n=1 Tax=Kutzneria sp. CA-103260 TaxID=2802641 RepID=UPI001BA7B935|nr:LLM class F420-dependent oxidoreductase [Kutzneria sp. CA-103260]QUQ71094.1 LLM class F420-dependent oxidoreductase [Kutzneria sp. CA-103260]
MELGRVGIWGHDIADDVPRSREAAAELDELGYGAIWIGGSPSVARAENVLAATTRLTVATGILNIWQHEAADVAAQSKAANEKFNGRFLLGLGASHAPLVKNYAKPFSAMRDYLAGLNAAGHPKQERVLAALGPKMLELSAQEAAGAHPYLVTPEHTARAREILGTGPLLAPELKAVLTTDVAKGREIARDHLKLYFQLPNYTNSLRTLGFTDADFADGGSDRIVDATVAIGDENVIGDRLQQHLDGGADHVCIQILSDPLPVAEWRSLSGLAQGLS